MKKLFILLMVCGFVALSARTASAMVIPFADTAIYWPGWNNGTADDSQDRIGAPEFTGGSATVIDNKLMSLSIVGDFHWNTLISPGDLFIDLGADNSWNYAVDLTSWTVAGPSNPDPAAGNYDLYSINLALADASGYIFSDSPAWTSNIRDKHPVALDITGLQASGQVGFSGWSNTNPPSSYPLVFNFGNGLDLGQSSKFTIGFGTNCANDVIYNTLNAVPEPGTMTLLGLGLGGLAFIRRRKLA
jgi:hypothetical protein